MYPKEPFMRCWFSAQTNTNAFVVPSTLNSLADETAKGAVAKRDSRWRLLVSVDGPFVLAHDVISAPVIHRERAVKACFQLKHVPKGRTAEIKAFIHYGVPGLFQSEGCIFNVCPIIYCTACIFILGTQ
jgi:hypothetical protein